MKVAFVIHAREMHGANQSLVNMIDAIADHAACIAILPAHHPGRKTSSDVAHELRRRNVRYIVSCYKQSSASQALIRNTPKLFARKLRDYFLNHAALLHVSHWLHSQHVDLVHSNSGVIDFGATLATRLKLPHIWHIREFQDKDFAMAPICGFASFRNKLRQADAVIYISRSIENHFGKTPNSLIIPNPIRAGDSPIASSHKENFFLFCGSIQKHKGIETAIEAFAEFSRAENEHQLIILGDGTPEYLRQLRKRLEKLGAAGRVKFLGFQDNQSVDDYMRKAKALLMCSPSEALGRVTIEAMFNDCLVIGCNSAATSELIEHLKTGLLYSSSTDLAHLLLFPITQPAQALEIRGSAINFATAHYSHKAFARKAIPLYNQIANH